MGHGTKGAGQQDRFPRDLCVAQGVLPQRGGFRLGGEPAAAVAAGNADAADRVSQSLAAPDQRLPQ